MAVSCMQRFSLTTCCDYYSDVRPRFLEAKHAGAGRPPSRATRPGQRPGMRRLSGRRGTLQSPGERAVCCPGLVGTGAAADVFQVSFLSGGDEHSPLLVKNGSGGPRYGGRASSGRDTASRAWMCLCMSILEISRGMLNLLYELTFIIPIRSVKILESLRAA